MDHRGYLPFSNPKEICQRGIFVRAFIILLQNIFHTWHIVPRFLIFGLALTVLEYAVGFLSEKVFKMTLWDYSENKLNLNGRVCLKFSIIWAVLAFTFVTLIHPVALSAIMGLDAVYIEIAAIAFVI
jgi:uncharacterized membrane protein